MAHERIKPEFSFDEEKIKQLKQIAPECFEDGKINFETLKQNLGDWTQDEEDSELEHFGLFWPGKKDARRLATIPPEGTLEPVYGEGLKADGTPDDDGINDSKNVFIEGENLEVLKILQKSYTNKIKMIYIDPPYNTGNDFIYDDDFTEPLQEYLRRTGQIDDEGKPFTTNKKADGRFHSKWLSMMYPRLRLARNLLREDGVIFISIDDNELHNLKIIMNEIYGEENYRGSIIRATGTRMGSGNKNISSEVDYVLIYSRDETFEFKPLPMNKEDLSIYNQEDEKGKYLTRSLRRTGGENRREDRPSMFYPVYAPDGTEILPIAPAGWESRWICSRDTYEKQLADNMIEWKKVRKGDEEKWQVYQKHYAGESTKYASNLWTDVDGNKKATREVNQLFNGIKYFDHPKPVGFIEKLLSISNLNPNDIILDFFAGSGSTAHAVIKYQEDKKNPLKFICIQLPEKTEKGSSAYKDGYMFISSISKTRIKNYITSNATSNGLHVVNLTESNYKKWNDVQKEDLITLQNSLDLFNSSPLRDDWNKNKLITELMLLEGFPLDSSQSKLEVGANEIIKVDSDMVPNILLICLDDKIEENLIENLELDSSSTFICLDSAISNQDKLRLSDKGLIKTI